MLVCVNASGTYRFNLSVVGKSKVPEALRAIINALLCLSKDMIYFGHVPQVL